MITDCAGVRQQALGARLIPADGDRRHPCSEREARDLKEPPSAPIANDAGVRGAWGEGHKVSPVPPHKATKASARSRGGPDTG